MIGLPCTNWPNESWFRLIVSQPKMLNRVAKPGSEKWIFCRAQTLRRSEGWRCWEKHFNNVDDASSRDCRSSRQLLCEAVWSAGNSSECWAIWCRSAEGVTVSNDLGNITAGRAERSQPGGAQSRHPALLFTRPWGTEPPFKNMQFLSSQIRMLSRPWRNAVTRSAHNAKAALLTLICERKRH